MKMLDSDLKVSYSDECWMKNSFWYEVCEKNVAIFSCCGKVL